MTDQRALSEPELGAYLTSVGVLPRNADVEIEFAGDGNINWVRRVVAGRRSWIVKQAREHRLVGATVIRGLEGFGAHGHLHTAKVLRQATDLPIIVEIVDSREKIEAFLPTIDGAISEGLATLEKVEIRSYRGGA